MGDTLAVLVPVLNRPQNVAPLVESFLTSGTPGTLWFIVTHGDEEESQAINAAWKSGKTGLIDVPDVTWPDKINLGVESVETADWYLCAADDITFTPGWWDATAPLRADPTIGVIGTHDSYDGTWNQAVAGHTHTCHPLIRATYIRDHGTIDERGKAVHDGYHHWYVDNELVITAKCRNAWAFCPDAVLEHHHPYWGYDVPFDATYQLGESRAAEDLALWQDRWLNVFQDGRIHTT